MKGKNACVYLTPSIRSEVDRRGALSAVVRRDLQRYYALLAKTRRELSRSPDWTALDWDTVCLAVQEDEPYLAGGALTAGEYLYAQVRRLAEGMTGVVSHDFLTTLQRVSQLSDLQALAVIDRLETLRAEGHLPLAALLFLE